MGNSMTTRQHVAPVYCVRCKAEIPHDATFCPKCGQTQDRRAAEQIAAQIAGEGIAAQKRVQDRAAELAAAKIAEDANRRIADRLNSRQGQRIAALVTAAITIAIVLTILFPGCLGHSTQITPQQVIPQNAG